MSGSGLADEEEFAVFGEGPDFVVYHQLEFVDVVADLIHEGTDVVVVCDRLFTLRLDTVRLLAGVDHVLDTALDRLDMVADSFDIDQVLRGDGVSLRAFEELLDLEDVVEEERLVSHRCGDDMVDGEISEDSAFDLDLLGIHLPLHLVAGFDLLARENAGLFEHLDGVGTSVRVIHQGSRSFDIEATASSLLLPLLAITIAVEVDSLRLCEEFLDLGEDSGFGVFALGYASLNDVGEVIELGSDGGIEGDKSRGIVGRRTDGAILEAVAGEGEWAGTVAVGIIEGKFGDLSDVECDLLLAVDRDLGDRVDLLHHVEDRAYSRAEEHRDDGRRSLIGAETVSVGGVDDRGFEEAVVFEDSRHDVSHEGNESEIIVLVLAGREEEDTIVGAEAPVVVLT